MIETEQVSLSFLVRDYECDMVGMVNNAVYQNYIEHARHEYLKSHSIDFADLAKRQIRLIVKRLELDFQFPLCSGDEFTVTTKLQRVSRLKFQFIQNIYRQPGGKLILSAKVLGSALNAQGRPELPVEISKLLPQLANT